MNNKNNRGPNTEPCGTPQQLTSVLEIYVPTCVIIIAFHCSDKTTISMFEYCLFFDSLNGGAICICFKFLYPDRKMMLLDLHLSLNSYSRKRRREKNDRDNQCLTVLASTNYNNNNLYYYT